MLQMQLRFCLAVFTYSICFIQATDLWYDNMDTGWPDTDNWPGTGKDYLTAVWDDNCPGTTNRVNSDRKICWTFAGYPQGTIYAQRSVSTSQYSSVGLTYSMRSFPQNTQQCYVCYSVNGGTCHNIMVQDATHQGTITARTYNSWTDAAGQNSLAIRIGKTGDLGGHECMFDEFRLWGNLATPAPTGKPTSVTTAPTAFTAAPSHNPTISTHHPSASPTKNPTASTNDPSAAPSKNPSASPSEMPSGSPTALTTVPSHHPSASSNHPSASPTKNPSKSPTKDPSASPSKSPSGSPSKNPSASPSEYPSASPITHAPTTPSGTVIAYCDDFGEIYHSDGAGGWILDVSRLEGSWTEAITTVIADYTPSMTVRVKCMDDAHTGGFMGQVTYGGIEYYSTNPISESKWRVTSATSGGTTSLEYETRDFNSEINDNAYWIWNGQNGAHIDFDFTLEPIATTQITQSSSAIGLCFQMAILVMFLCLLSQQ